MSDTTDLPYGDNPYNHHHEWVAGEEERLRSMDGWVSYISAIAVGEALDKKILDIGAGSGENTGKKILSAGGNYVALDISTDLISARQPDSGHRLVADARHLPFDDNSFNISHSRAVLGWFNADDRPQVIAEHLRVAEEAALFLNFDWSAVQGEIAVQQLRTFMMRILTSVGYSPEYGRYQQEEITTHLENNDIDASVSTVIQETDSLLTDVMPIVSESVVTLRDQLLAFGNIGVATSLDRSLQAVKDYVEAGGQITLPAMHVTKVTF